MKVFSLLGLALTLVATPAVAHVEVIGPAVAGANQEITFVVGHGCEGLDTYSLRIEIPEAITSVRVVSSTLGKPTLEKNEADLVSAVSWQKADVDVLDEDVAFYKMVLRLRVPDAPFTTLHFLATQVCRSPDGSETATVEWTSLVDNGHGEGPGPAAALKVVPARAPGWNQYTVPAAIDDLGAWFADAQIVWKDAAAFSTNAATVAQIAATSGVTALAVLAAGDSIWVKY